MENTSGYQVSLDAFEGPLDLLLFLIRKKKIDIHDIPISSITREYLDYLEHKDRINLEFEGEFLLVASLLIHIKSQMLLPREVALDEEQDPRRALVDRLLDYQNIKAACAILREKEKGRIKSWRREFQVRGPVSEDVEFMEVSLFDLAEMFFALMKKQAKRDIRIIKGKEYSLKEKTEELLELLRQNGYLDFQKYFEGQASFNEALLAFFCILHLIKNRIVMAVQDGLFSPIKVWLRPEEDT